MKLLKKTIRAIKKFFELDPNNYSRLDSNI